MDDAAIELMGANIKPQAKAWAVQDLVFEAKEMVAYGAVTALDGSALFVGLTNFNNPLGSVLPLSGLLIAAMPPAIEATMRTASAAKQLLKLSK